MKMFNFYILIFITFITLIYSEIDDKIIEKDLYKTLQLSNNATLKEIKKSFRKLAQKYHPDKVKDSEDLFRTIAEAYEILSNDKTRFEYDEKRKYYLYQQNTNQHQQQYQQQQYDQQYDYNTQYNDRFNLFTDTSFEDYHDHSYNPQDQYHYSMNSNGYNMFDDFIFSSINDMFANQFSSPHYEYTYQPSMLGYILRTGQMIFPYESILTSQDGLYFAMLDQYCSLKLYRGDVDKYIRYISLAIYNEKQNKYQSPQDIDISDVFILYETPSFPSILNNNCFGGLDDLGVFYIFQGQPNHILNILWTTKNTNQDDNNEDPNYIYNSYFKTFYFELTNYASFNIWSINNRNMRFNQLNHKDISCEWSTGSCDVLLANMKHINKHIEYYLYTNYFQLKRKINWLFSKIYDMFHLDKYQSIIKSFYKSMRNIKVVIMKFMKKISKYLVNRYQKFMES